MAVTIRMRKNDYVTTGITNADLTTQRASGASMYCYWLKQSLVAAGWTVYYSSNGSTTSSSDLWTTSAFQAVAFVVGTNTGTTSTTVDGIWCCLRSPTTDANGDYLHICLCPSQAIWADPTAPIVNQAMGTYGVQSTWGSFAFGLHSGFLRMGLALSSGAAAFTGGAASVSTTVLTAAGALPVATGVVWSVAPLGRGYATNAYTSMTVLTEGNQFIVIQDTGTYAVASRRLFFGLAGLVDGGYCTIHQGISLNTTATNLYRTSELMGGYYNFLSATSTGAYLSQLGGARSVYIRRVSGIVKTGLIDCLEPPGWDFFVNHPNDSGVTTFPQITRLRAYGCSDPSLVDLGDLTDFLMLGDKPLADNDTIEDSGSSTKWFALLEPPAYLVKWDWSDIPGNRTVITNGW